MSARSVSALLAPLGIEHTLQYRRGVPPVVNEEVSTRILTHAIEAIGPDVLADTRQSGGGEDFSWYLEEVPGAMARLGVWSGRGPQLDLHQPTFDLDERALAVGVRVLANIVEQAAAVLASFLPRACVSATRHADDRAGISRALAPTGYTQAPSDRQIATDIWCALGTAPDHRRHATNSTGCSTPSAG